MVCHKAGVSVLHRGDGALFDLFSAGETVRAHSCGTADELQHFVAHHGQFDARRSEYRTPYGVRVYSRVYFWSVSHDSRVYLSFAGRFLAVSPHRSVAYLNDGHVFGLKRNVIETRRSDEHMIFVQSDRGISPGALHQIFFKQIYAAVLDDLAQSEFFFLSPSHLIRPPFWKCFPGLPCCISSGR